MILKEFSIPNTRKHLLQLVADYPKALVALEVGTHSPWISRLLVEAGCEVIVANARKLRAIYQNERKCDKIDAQMLAKLVRVDPSLLHPVQHACEQCQRDSLNLKLRDILVRQRVHIISSVRGVLKSTWNTWVVSVPVQAGQTYTFRLKPNARTLPDPFGVAIGADNPYSGGVLGHDDPSGSYQADFDAVFRTYVKPAE